MDLLQIRVDSHAPYEAGAVLLSVLAFARSAGQDVLSGHAALCNLALRAKAAAADGWPWSIQGVKPAYLAPEAASPLVERTVVTRLNHRLRAARIAIPQLVQIETGTAPRLSGIKRISVRELAERDLREQSIGPDAPGNVSNVTTKIWRPSLPVIHLAVATAMAIDHAAHVARRQVHLENLLWVPELIAWIIDRATVLEPLAERLPRVKRMPELIRLRRI